jgi:hypothetical protein
VEKFVCLKAMNSKLWVALYSFEGDNFAFVFQSINNSIKSIRKSVKKKLKILLKIQKIDENIQKQKGLQTLVIQ